MSIPHMICFKGLVLMQPSSPFSNSPSHHSSYGQSYYLCWVCWLFIVNFTVCIIMSHHLTGGIYMTTFSCKNREICLRFYLFIYTNTMKTHMQNKDFWIRKPKWRLRKWSQKKRSCKQQKQFETDTWIQIWPWYSQERLVEVSYYHFVKADTRFFHRPVFSHAASRQWRHANYWAWYHIPCL